jgi:CSLREA domain-containing protein
MRRVGVLIAAGLATLVAASTAPAATIHVNTAADVIGGDGKCSLREAITAANTDSPGGGLSGECTAGSGADVIILPAGRYTLAIKGASEDQNASGDLDIRSDVTLQGAGAAKTTIDAGGLDRVLDIPVAAAKVRIDGLTLTRGRAPGGDPGTPASPGANGVNPGDAGGDSGGGNGKAGEDGGAIRNAGTLTVAGCVIAANRAGPGGRGGDGAQGGTGGPGGHGGASYGGYGGTGGMGGGIASSGTLTVTDSTITGNVAGGGGRGGDGATAGAGGDATTAGADGGVGGTTQGGIGGSGGRGGGIWASATLTIIRSTIAGNAAGIAGQGGEAGIAGAGGHGADGASGQAGGAGGAGGHALGGGGGLHGGDGGGIYAFTPTSIDSSAIINNHAGNGNAAGAAGTPAHGGSGGAGTLGGAGGAGGSSIGGAGGSGGWGGGIYGGADLSITSSTIAGNRAGSGGPAAVSGDGALGGSGGFSSGLFAGATGGKGGASEGGFGGIGGRGGGITARTPSLVNVTLSGNVAGYGTAGTASATGGTGGTGGGSFLQGGQGGDGGDSIGGRGGGGGDGGGIISGKLVHVTVVGNSVGAGGGAGAAGAGGSGGLGGRQTAGTHSGQPGSTGTTSDFGSGTDGSGGGGFGETVGFGPLTLTNSLMANNSPSNCAGALVNGGHNLNFPSSACPGKVADPKLGALQDNGGPAPTIALGEGSAALDAVPATGAGCVGTDERGVPRPQHGACDIGAYENLPAKVTTGSVTSLTATSAVLRGTVTPNAHATVAFVIQATGGSARTIGRGTTTGLLPNALSTIATGLRPGTQYRYHVVLTRLDGTNAGVTRTFTTPRRVATLGGLTIKPGSFAPAAGGPSIIHRGGATIRFRLSRGVAVTFTAARCIGSRETGRGVTCRRFAAVRGAFTYAGKTGSNVLHFSGRISGHALAAGRYRLTARTQAPSASRSSASAFFRITRR